MSKLTKTETLELIEEFLEINELWGSLHDFIVYQKGVEWEDTPFDNTKTQN